MPIVRIYTDINGASIATTAQMTSKSLQPLLQKYIPQCDKHNHVILRFGRVVPSNIGSICQLPIDGDLLRGVQSTLQSTNAKYTKTTVSGYRVFHNGVYYEINRKSGVTTKIRRTELYHGEIGNVLMNYTHIDEDDGVIPCIVEPNMEEEYEQTIYTCSESGLVDVDWVIEYLPNVRITSLYCIIRKPVQPLKLWKLIETLGLSA